MCLCLLIPYTKKICEFLEVTDNLYNCNAGAHKSSNNGFEYVINYLAGIHLLGIVGVIEPFFDKKSVLFVHISKDLYTLFLTEIFGYEFRRTCIFL